MPNPPPLHSFLIWMQGQVGQGASGPPFWRSVLVPEVGPASIRHIRPILVSGGPSISSRLIIPKRLGSEEGRFSPYTGGALGLVSKGTPFPSHRRYQ